jgi:hypothetical protein
VLAGAGGACVALAQAGEGAGAGRRELEASAGERIAHADVVIEIGEWGNAVGVCGRAFDDHGEPEAQLAEPDRHGLAVDAEDGAREQVSATGVGVTRVPEACEEGVELFEEMDEEGAGATGGIDHPQRLDAGAQRVTLLGGNDRAVGCGGLANEGECLGGIGEQCGERGVDGVADQRGRRVVRSGASSLAAGHESLEGAPEHFGVDGGFRPLRGVFVRREAVPVDDGDNEMGDGIVGKAPAVPPPFECGGGEESAVEEGNGAEGARGGRALAGRGVEGTEEEGAKQAIVEAPSGFQLLDRFREQEVAPLIEPSLRFEEREEQAS